MVYYYSIPDLSDEIMVVQVYSKDRPLEQALIYQGPPKRLPVVLSEAKSVWYRFCEQDDCDGLKVLKPDTPTPGTDKKYTLSKPKRGSSLRRIGKKLQADGVRFVGAADLSAHVLAPCGTDPGPLLGVYTLRLPALGTVEVSHQYTKLEPGGHWIWVGRNRKKNVIATFEASDCEHRPFGSIRTTKGSFWIRPVTEGEVYGVYKMEF